MLRAFLNRYKEFHLKFREKRIAHLHETNNFCLTTFTAGVHPFMDEVQHIPPVNTHLRFSRQEGEACCFMLSGITSWSPAGCVHPESISSFFHLSFCEFPQADLASWHKKIRTSSSISLFLSLSSQLDESMNLGDCEPKANTV